MENNTNSRDASTRIDELLKANNELVREKRIYKKALDYVRRSVADHVINDAIELAEKDYPK